MATTKETQTKRILKAFKEHGTVTNAQLNRISFRYSARIHELRKDGYLIATEPLGHGLFRFSFNGHVEDRQLPENWSEIKASASEDDASKVSVID